MFIGMILALEGFAQFNAIGMADRMGGIINSSVVKQIGPVLAAVMVAGRVGGALAAELGTMRVTEQLDAMQAMSVDPVRNLVVPRFVRLRRDDADSDHVLQRPWSLGRVGHSHRTVRCEHR